MYELVIRLCTRVRIIYPLNRKIRDCLCSLRNLHNVLLSLFNRLQISKTINEKQITWCKERSYAEKEAAKMIYGSSQKTH